MPTHRNPQQKSSTVPVTKLFEICFISKTAQTRNTEAREHSGHQISRTEQFIWGRIDVLFFVAFGRTRAVLAWSSLLRPMPHFPEVLFKTVFLISLVLLHTHDIWDTVRFHHGWEISHMILFFTTILQYNCMPVHFLQGRIPSHPYKLQHIASWERLTGKKQCWAMQQ